MYIYMNINTYIAASRSASRVAVSLSLFTASTCPLGVNAPGGARTTQTRVYFFSVSTDIASLPTSRHALSPTSSDGIYLLMSFRKSPPPQHRQLNISTSYRTQYVDDFWGELTI